MYRQSAVDIAELIGIDTGGPRSVSRGVAGKGEMDCEREVSDFLVDEVGFSAARLQTLKDSITA